MAVLVWICAAAEKLRSRLQNLSGKGTLQPKGRHALFFSANGPGYFLFHSTDLLVARQQAREIADCKTKLFALLKPEENI
jgi:hypothetical protein